MRYYDIKGRRLPSVTSLLGLLPEPPALTHWKKTTANYDEVSKKSIVVGTLTHFRIENDLARKHGLPLQKLNIEPGMPTPDEDMRTRVQSNFENYLKWYEEFKPIPLMLEKVIWNEVLGYAGTCDMVCRINNAVYLVDFKTGKSIYDKYGAQLWAYREALDLMGDQGIHVEGCCILRLGDGDWEFAGNLNVSGDMIFEALELYNCKHPGK